MKRIALAVGISLLFAVSAFAVETVVSTHAVLAEFAQVVGGDSIDVVSIIPSGFCPAHYDLAPSDVAAVMNASLVLYSGFEPWMETLLDATESGGTMLQLPGSWSTPDAAVGKVEAIRDALSERFPESASTFAANAETYIETLRALGSSLRAQAEAADVSSTAIICIEWQVDFISWLGFEIAATYGVPEGLSLKDLVQLAEVGRSTGASLVVDNLQSGVGFGAKLAQELRAIHVVLSNFPGAMPGTATVPDLFTKNAEALLSAIAPLE